MSFTPVIKTTNSVLKTIHEFANERKLDPKDLEFELLSYETLVKNSIDDEYKVLESAQIFCEDELLDPMLLIVQEYHIRIFPKEDYKPISTINLSLATDKLRVRAVATLGAGTVFVGHKGVLRELRDAIWKKKLLAGLFIDFFETNMVDQLKKLVTLVGFNKPLGKDIKFSIAQGINPQPPLDGKLVRVYEESQKANNLINAIETGTLVLRYIKPKAGVDGRGCDGKYIQAREYRDIDLKPLVDESVRIVEEENETLYYAATDGYIAWEGENFKLSKTLVLERANFKSSSNIDAGEVKDISVHIGGKQDSGEDTIGSGVKIDVKELSVGGSVGSNVNISANDLSVDAQTHRKSKLEVANIANIKLHRGDLRASEANIEILEVGKVTAEKLINIKQMLGGEAIAPVVKVDEVLSNCIITASELIEIGNINGTGVKLIIDPNSVESYHNQIKEILSKLKLLSAQLRLGKEALQKDQKEHFSSIERIKSFQLKILQAQKAGREPMKQDIIRVGQYRKTLEKLKARAAQIVQDELELERLEVQQERLYKQDLHAKIVHHGVYDGHTQIIFIDPKTKEKIIVSPVGKRETITVVIGSEGREIKMV